MDVNVDPYPFDFKKLPRMPLTRLNQAGIQNLLPTTFEDFFSTIFNPYSSFLKETELFSIGKKIYMELLELTSTISASWKWKLFRILPANQRDCRTFLEECHIRKRTFIRLVLSICNRVLPEDLLGFENTTLLAEFIWKCICSKHLPKTYPDFKLLDSKLLRVSRSKDVRKCCADEEVELCHLQKSSFQKVVHFCAQFVGIIIMHFIKIRYHSNVKGTVITLYSRHGFTYWKLKKLRQFKKDYQLKRAYWDYKFKAKHLVSTLKFLPTDSSLRAICPFKKKANWQFTNYLKVLNRALDYHLRISKWPKVLTLDKVSKDIKKFFNDFTTNSRDKRLYFVKTDVSNCYGSIKHNVLEKCLQQLIQNRRVVIAYCFVQNFKKKWFRLYASGNNVLEAHENLQRRVSIVASTASHVTIMYETFSSNLVDIIMDLLSSFLIRIKNGSKQLYKIQKGVPQGSSISSRLSHIYLCYHDMYRFQVVSRDKVTYRLFRYVDDYLLISDDRKIATELLDKILLPENYFGLLFKKEKTEVSFSSGLMKRKGRNIIWCGHQINTHKKRIEKYCTTSIPKIILGQMKGSYKSRRDFIMLRRSLRDLDRKFKC